MAVFESTAAKWHSEHSEISPSFDVAILPGLPRRFFSPCSVFPSLTFRVFTLICLHRGQISHYGRAGSGRSSFDQRRQEFRVAMHGRCRAER